jgi:WD40 repeat protein
VTNSKFALCAARSYVTPPQTWDSDGRYLATGGAGGTTTVWDWSSRRQRAKLAGHGRWINSLAFSPDSSVLATGIRAGLVTLWDVRTNAEWTTFQAVDRRPVSALAFSADGAMLATTNYPEGPVRLWTVPKGELRMELPRTALGVRAVAFSPDGMLLAMALKNGTAMLWGIAEARELGSVRTNARGLQAATFSRDGHLLATGDTDGYVRLLDVSQAITKP